MKRFCIFILGTGLLACTLPLASGRSAIQEKPGPASFPPVPALFTHSDSPDPQQGQQPEAKTFIGRISKNGQKFVLEDSSMRTSYQLDDQQKAEKFQGKNVRIVGTLEPDNNLIHIQSIEEAV